MTVNLNRPPRPKNLKAVNDPHKGQIEDSIYTHNGKIMNGVLITAVVLGSSVLALAVIGGTILMAIKIIKGGVSTKNQIHQAEEAKMIQEIYQGLSRMEQRVEALETILFDRERKDRNP
jgi:phage shock protein B